MLFFGAGVSKPLGVPTMEELTDEVIKILETGMPYPPPLLRDLRSKTVELRAEPGDFEKAVKILEEGRPDLASLVREIRGGIAGLGLKPDIEAVLTVLEGDTALHRRELHVAPLASVISRVHSNARASMKADVASLQIKNALYYRCSQINSDLAVRLFGTLWETLMGSDRAGRNPFDTRRRPEPIFTTNYDLCIETFLKRQSIVYDDGFQMDVDGEKSFAGRWEKGLVHLYKLHGSIDYYQRLGREKVVRSDTPIEDKGFILSHHGPIAGRIIGVASIIPCVIYPDGQEYVGRVFRPFSLRADELEAGYRSPSRPFGRYMDELKACLARESVCVAIGYSFRDVPINSVFLDAVQRNDSLRIILVDPSADDVRSTLDESLRKHVIPLRGEFGQDRLPLSIIEQIREQNVTLP